MTSYYVLRLFQYDILLFGCVAGPCFLCFVSFGVAFLAFSRLPLYLSLFFYISSNWRSKRRKTSKRFKKDLLRFPLPIRPDWRIVLLVAKKRKKWKQKSFKRWSKHSISSRPKRWPLVSLALTSKNTSSWTFNHFRSKLNIKAFLTTNIDQSFLL